MNVPASTERFWPGAPPASTVYLSHPVRRMRRDPGAATAGLVVELDAGTEASILRGTVEGAGGEVVRDLGFDCWLVRLPEAAVDDLCSLDGVVRVETDATLERSVDETVGDGESGGGGPDVPDDVDREV